MRRALPLALAALTACSSNPPQEGTLRVIVDVSDDALTSRRAKLFARGATNTLETACIDLAGKDRFVIAVLQGAEMADAEYEAVGYSDDACTSETSPRERTEARRAPFGMPGELTLTLRREVADAGTDAGVDNDGDGHFTPADCDDNNGAVHPGATEQCANTLDDDCDGNADCRDDACDNQACGVGAVCTTQRCAEVLCADGVDNDGTEGRDCADPDCDGVQCMNGGTCADAGCRTGSELGLCDDNVDNDGDGDIDCADADCPTGSACDDTDACTTRGTCNGTTCVTAPVLCSSSNQCTQNMGICDPDGGMCRFTPTPDAGCNDGRACTDNDTCDGDGGCRGTQRACSTPPTSCFTTTGQCDEAQDGGCVYTPLAVGTGTCDDNNACTDNDTCDGDGGCRGVSPNCAPMVCHTTSPAACTSTDRCGYVPQPNGTPCSGGTCVAGACSPTPPVFIYTPSNFTEAQLPTSLGARTINCDAVTINTGLDDGGVALIECDGSVSVPPHTLVPNGGTEATLVYFDALNVGSGGRLRGRGRRPLIIAVKTDVSISGLVEVDGFDGAAFARGAGAHTDCATGAGRAGRTNGDESGGGGGGAFGGNGGFGHRGTGTGLGGDAGVAWGNATLVPLVAGCNGGPGGRANATNLGRAGRGGGALQISAGGLIHFTGNISANGSGGEGGVHDTRTGGGGGGSGGAVLLEAQGLSSSSNGDITANGGGGGEGSGYGSALFDGAAGANGAVSLNGARGGDNGATCGGNGGDGAAFNNPTADDGEGPDCSAMPGGGGGGSMGRIRTNAYDGGCNFHNQSWFSPARTGVGTNCQ